MKSVGIVRKQNNVRLRATDDRLCEDCFQANEVALRLGYHRIDNSHSEAGKKPSFACNTCLQYVDATVRCAICDNNFDQQCTGMSNDTFEILISIISDSGWVCRDCRGDQKSTINQLKVALATTNETVADMKAVIQQMNDNINTLKTFNSGTRIESKQQVESNDAHQVREPNLATVVCKTVAEITKRKKKYCHLRSS